MNTAIMNTEAARCFRRACEADDPLDQTIFIGMRQAWLALALQVEQRRMEQPGLVMPAEAAKRGEAPSTKRRSRRTAAKPLAARKSSRARRRKVAA